MTQTLFPTPTLPVLPVEGETAGYPVRRIFCVGRNYAAHAAEMGAQVDREAPFYFTKSPFAVVLSGATVAYAPGTQNLHHEVELVLALGAALFRATPEQAQAAIWACGCGLDMTRRDLQNGFKDKRLSWDLGKDFEESAVFAPLARGFALAAQRIHLEVNGETRQDGRLDDMIWSAAELIAHLSQYYHLQPGDLIMTGTPSGVGPVVPGDVITATIDGLPPLRLTIGAPA
ncbi:fumarylacetoacetate hydrolase family protein [Paenirhodobacter sp.]|uniref:fumarylacetoacetate hydrolase family protein n=1 Tax=Paenirhodobacter sp. TaxID=1965326 RepID=UPI003B3E3C08